MQQIEKNITNPPFLAAFAIKISLVFSNQKISDYCWLNIPSELNNAGDDPQIASAKLVSVSAGKQEIILLFTMLKNLFFPLKQPQQYLDIKLVLTPQFLVSHFITLVFTNTIILSRPNISFHIQHYTVFLFRLFIKCPFSTFTQPIKNHFTGFFWSPSFCKMKQRSNVETTFSACLQKFPLMLLLFCGSLKAEKHKNFKIII